MAVCINDSFRISINFSPVSRLFISSVFPVKEEAIVLPYSAEHGKRCPAKIPHKSFSAVEHIG